MDEHLKDEMIFEFLKNDEEFFEQYLYSFLDRFVYFSTEIEGEMDSNKRIHVISNLLEALKIALDKKDVLGLPSDIIAIGDAVNDENGIYGIRKINVDAGRYATFLPSDNYMIYNNLYILLDNYLKIWCDLDPYEREAAFHIDLMRIHPFEDGNKRVAKIILTANLIKANCAPVIISAEDTEEYYEYLNNRDMEGFGKIIRERSHMELINMIASYKAMRKIPIETSIVDIILKQQQKK